MNNTEKILFMDNAIAEYHAVRILKGCKSPIDVANLNASLLDIGCSNMNEYYTFRFSMNFKEVDRCFRFRRNDDLNKPALCDSCAGRAVTPCYAISICGENGTDYTSVFDNYTPDMLFKKEQENEAISLGITPAFFPRVINHFLLTKCNYTIEGYCVGRSVQIAEPAFDVLLKMEQIVDLGYTIYNKFLEVNQ